MSRAMTLAIERIADDPRFAARFRRDPERALRRYRLDADQIAAIKAGDAAALARHGVDVVAFDRGTRHGLRRYWRKVLVAGAVAGAFLGTVASPTAANTHCEKLCIRLTGLRRARYSQGGEAIRIGRVLVRRSSLRYALRRAGVPRMDAPGRTALRESFARFQEEYGEQQVELSGEEIAPFVLAGD